MRSPLDRIVFPITLAVLFSSTAATGAAAGQAEERELGWSDTAELTLVVTAGNAKAQTLGFRNTLVRRSSTATLTFDVSALRADSLQKTPVAIGDSRESFQIIWDSARTLIAENYFARGRLERNLSTRTFWHAGGSWDRNTFAGFNNLYVFDGGIGNTWLDSATTTLKTFYAISETRREDVEARPEDNKIFTGVRLRYEYRRQVTPTTEFTSELVLDENLENLEDFRTDMGNAIAVSMNSRLALKVSWQLRYRRQPARKPISLLLPDGTPTGTQVDINLEPVDQIMTFALVGRF